MKINIKGPIIPDAHQWIYDWFGIPAVSPSKVGAAIQKAVQEEVDGLTVIINSGGGSVFDASEIYTALKSFKGDVKVEIVGLAASAASVIAMAGSKIEMSPTAQLMIHNASTGNWGDYRTMDHTSDFLQNVNKSIMNAYTVKTGKDDEDLKNMMDDETWMTAQQALDHGFIDAIMFAQEPVATANVERPELVNGILPQEVIDKVRNELLKDKSVAAINTVEPTAPTMPTNKNEEGKRVMNLEELKNTHPELYKQVKNEGYEEGAAAENSRIKAIDSLKKPQDIKAADFHDIINKAKFETQASAGDTAVELLNKAVRNDQEAKQTFLDNRATDAAALNQVPGGDAPPPANGGAENDQDADNIIAAFAKGGTQ